MKNVYTLIAAVALGLVAWKVSSTPLEIFAATMGLLSVFAYGRQMIWMATITGVANIVAFSFIFFDAKLYADMTLQIGFFLPLTLYGIIYWIRNRGNGEKVAKTRNISKVEFWNSIVFWLIGSAVWAVLLDKLTDAAMPWIDAPVAVASIIAQLLLSRKVLQNWHIWIVIDVVSVFMYWMRDLHLTSALYFVFLIICVFSLRSWKKELAT